MKRAFFSLTSTFIQVNHIALYIWEASLTDFVFLMLVTLQKQLVKSLLVLVGSGESVSLFQPSALSLVYFRTWGQFSRHCFNLSFPWHYVNYARGQKMCKVMLAEAEQTTSVFLLPPMYYALGHRNLARVRRWLYKRARHRGSSGFCTVPLRRSRR